MKTTKRAARITFWAVFLSLGLVVGVANADIKEGLLVHWTFDDVSGAVAVDKSGNGRDGALVNDPQWVAGKVKGALDFAGNGDHVVAENAASYMDGLNALTIALWINSDVTGTDSGFIIFHDPSGNDTRDIRYDAAGSAGGGTSVIKYGIPCTGGGEEDESSSNVQTTDWQHIALTWTSGLGLSLYINGVLDTPQFDDPAQTGATTGLSKVIVGKGGKDEGASASWDGLIDEVRIYNRALSSDDIVELVEWTGGVSAAAAPSPAEAGQTVTLIGSGPEDTTSYAWEQVIVGEEPHVTIIDPTNATATVESPVRDIGYMLTFRLTVESPTEGTLTDEVRVKCLAPNAPQVTPGNLRMVRTNKGFRLSWDEVFDAEAYAVEIEYLPDVWVPIAPNLHALEYEATNQTPGDEVSIRVAAKNSYGSGAASEPVSVTIMRNVALPAPAGDRPPLPHVQGVTYVISHYGIGGMNDGAYDDTNDSWDGNAKDEDYWGYLWGEDLWFDAIVYCAGNLFSDGGWFTEVTVEFTQDGGATWAEAPEVRIEPPYDLTDLRAGREPFSRFDISIKPVRGNGMRLFGIPGGTADFTSIAELEVYGNQDQGPLVVYGVDAEFAEGTEAILDGSYSFSTRGAVSGFQWVQTGGPGVTIADANQAKTTFAAPSVDEDTFLTFQFTAQDDQESYTDDVYITIKNLKTTAVAGQDQTVIEGQEVALNGSGSVTTSETLTYLWEQIDDGLRGTILNAGIASPTFITPFIYELSQDCILQLTVDDGLGNVDSVSTDTVTITANDRHGALIVREAENYTSTADNGDIRSWNRVEGDPTYMTTDMASGENAEWDSGCDLSYDITILTAGTYTPLLRRYITGGGDNSCQVGVDGTVAINEFDNDGTPVDVWVWITEPGQFITFDTPGDYVLNIRRREGGYRIDKLILYAGNPTVVPAEGSTEVGPPAGNWVGPIFCDRTLGTHYTPGSPLDVSLTIDVNSDTPPATLVITENIPAGITVSSAEGNPDLSTPGTIIWTLTGAEVDNRTVSYTLEVPAGTTATLAFEGDVNGDGILGQNAVYAVPSAPQYVSLDMMLGAQLSWSAPPEEGADAYRVYRSVDGGDWAEVAFTRQTSYSEGVVEGSTYSYKVMAVSKNGVEGPFCEATEAMTVTVPTVVEAENYNYGGGEYPGYENCDAANEAPDSDTVGTPADYDFFYATDVPVDDTRRFYRPNDNCGMETREATPNIGWTTIGDWWRYTLDVPEPGPGEPTDGWARVGLKIASNPTCELYWDEGLIGTVSASTGDWGAFVWAPLADAFRTTPGEHTLRVKMVSGGMNFDSIGVGFNLTISREAIFEDDFEDYTNLYDWNDLETVGNWDVVNGSGEPDVGWRLWSTTGNYLGDETDDRNPAITGMTGNYVISDSDLVGTADLDEQLVTPDIDCTEYIRLKLDFSKNFRVYPDDADHTQIAEVDIREVGGGWVNLLSYNVDSVDPNLDPAVDSSPEKLDLSAYDGKTFQLRWHFYEATWDWWWAIDNVMVSGEPKPTEVVKPEIFTFTIADGQLTFRCYAPDYVNFTMEYTDDLTADNWQVVPGVDWPITDTVVVITVPFPGPAVFFRIGAD